MPLENGTRLGHYQITAPLGAGGMGEVYRARDTKLNREVALKVLPAVFANNPERMARFQREAHLLASLNHPNIAAIYGLEDSGRYPAIVMELVEGETLKGPLPVGEALRLAKQIAEAIEYAHDKGVIHRDLKPANIKVTPEGSVKVLDFGLAKALDDAGDSSVEMHGTMSPTLTLGATHAGVILGTAAYMAPEQAKGKKADRRADVWAFGVVLCEMLTGERMFGGETAAETLASVMKEQLTFGSLPDDTPAAIRKLVTRCLDRDLRRRMQSIGEARIIIEDVIAGVAPEEGGLQPAQAFRPVSRAPWAVAGAALLAAAVAFGWNWSRPAPPSPNVTRFTIPPPDGAVITGFRAFASNLAVSPDGRYVAFLADEPGRDRTIWVRALDSLIAQRLDRTEGAIYPFWSPDSKNIAYFAGGKLMRIPVAGGSPLTIADAPDGEGGTWFQAEGQDGVVVFAPSQNGPLQRVLAQGGVPTPVTQLAEGDAGHVFPQFLPDGQRFLYLTRGDMPAIYVQTLGSEDRTLVTAASSRAMFSPPGFLLYLRDSTLLAHRWNLDTLKLEGEPVSLADDVRAGGGNGRNAFTVSANGVLAYRSGGNGSGNMQVSWYARDGKPDEVVLETGDYGPIELSPDDQRLVVVRGSASDGDLWLKDLASGIFSRLTSATGLEADQIWSPDSRRVAYVGGNAGKESLFETLIGSGKHTPIPNDGKQNRLEDWTRDGKQLLTRANAVVNLLPAPQEGATKAGGDKPQPVFDEPYVADQFRVSPDAKWVAYTSFESGQPEVNLASFPAFTDRRQISVGGLMPRWRADGKELFFVSLDRRVQAVDVRAGATLETGPIRTLFQISMPLSTGVFFYAVTGDGQRFLVREPVGSSSGATEQLYVVTNWTSLVGP